ncbi:hypothetical protein [Vibrio cholerae]|uniref:hypothetical protein n=1 Tax=Vibrio cholerae TaxID=666 RepID=UPI0009AD9557|nr:hypothetical protein [Vibrio cholerae]ELL8243022.1 hypothetical protein [Vibrio cholerae]MCX9667423.1 hypothetical protein [Vibrio cholerae]HAS4214173.1 hypothetical protein [Vibrio cholerae]HCG2061666.1 hypothetical protein [Vibrio cholerae]HDI3159644.1 hypothetical protein [Vibrio cholerae]
MKSVFEPLNALLFICMALITLVFKPTVTKKVLKPVINSKRSLLVKLRFLSKWFTKQVPYFAPFVLSVSGLIYVLSGGAAAAVSVLIICALPVLLPTPSHLV